MFGVTKITVYPLPEFDIASGEVKDIWRVDVRHGGGGISTEYGNASHIKRNRTEAVPLSRLKDADEAEQVGRDIAARMGVKRLWVRKFATYNDYLNRWIP